MGNDPTAGASARWRRFLAVAAREAEQIGGFGTVTAAITFRDGAPCKVDIVSRCPAYHLDHDAPPLTPTGRRAIIPDEAA
jgi:hypothetical protein